VGANVDADVIIVGAGPVGLALAKGLALDGRRVLVLEKKPGLSQHSKALTLWAGTQDVVERLGLLQEFEKRSLCRDDLQLWDADGHRALAHLPLFELAGETKHARLLLLPQNVTEEVLFEGLAREKSATTIFDANVTSLIDEGSRVSVKYVKDGEEHTVHGRFAIGCDGAHSAVRAALGFHLEGETYSIKAGLADVELGDLTKEYEYPRFSTKDGLAFAIKASPTMWRLIFIDKVTRAWDLDRLTKEAVANIFDQTNYKLIWASEFRLHRRTSEAFAKGNMVLAGDAAHLNSPIGGQGMNSGIRDTEPLREALRRAFEQNSNAPLNEYAVKRKAEVEHGVNRYTGFMTSLLFSGGGRHVKDVVRALGVGFKLPAIRHAFLRRAMMISQTPTPF
jgi:2-polyprenyl-6-methoxyphenol hydroxylase-like FAD-dependent oxidoreductase